MAKYVNQSKALNETILNIIFKFSYMIIRVFKNFEIPIHNFPSVKCMKNMSYIKFDTRD